MQPFHIPMPKASGAEAWQLGKEKMHSTLGREPACCLGSGAWDNAPTLAEMLFWECLNAGTCWGFFLSFSAEK